MRLPALTLIVVSTLAGCAFTKIPLNLPSENLVLPVPGGNQRQVVVVVPFRDERLTKHRCGMNKNGYNMDTADAVCQSDPNEWFALILAAELRTSGFTVLKPTDEHRPDAVRIDGSLLKIFVEPVIGAWSGSLEADLSVRLHVTTETGLDATRTFFVKGWKPAGFSILGAYQESLHRATQAILEQMVSAIKEIMDEYPQLGWQRRYGASVAALPVGASEPGWEGAR